jgi:hypothetical protein
MLGIFALSLLSPKTAEIKTLLFLIVLESLAIALSSLSSYIFTKLDFIKIQSTNVLSAIFLSVHLLIGFGVLGIYFTFY